MRLYLAGPMRGHPRFNFDAFLEAARQLRNRGYDVFSPAEHDLLEGFDPDNPGEITSERYEAWMRRDFQMIDYCDAICLMPGWSNSVGAAREECHARLLGKGLFYLEDLLKDTVDGCPCKAGESAVVDVREVRVKNEKTGGEKGSKPARFDLLPAKALWKVAELYGAGAKKYSAHNWRKGYAWSLSVAALERHLALWKEGETLDAETRCHHLASVVFHALSLLTFEDEHPELDDRWKGAE